MSAFIHEKSGARYNDWTIRQFHKIDSHGDARWWCTCERCGRDYSVKGYTLRNGQSTKCRQCADKERR